MKILTILVQSQKKLLKGLEDLEIRGQVKTIQNNPLLGIARILRRVLKIVETCYHSNSSERPPPKTDVKN